MTNTTNYNLKKPATSDYYNVQDQNDNMDIIDAALKPTADPALVPSGNVGKLAQWVSWIANRIKAITGDTNWYDDPPITLAEADNLISSHLAENEAHTEAVAKIIYVSTAGSDTTGNGSSGSPFATITHAISTVKKNLASQVKIRVLAGDYTGEGTINIKNFKGNELIITAFDGTNDVTTVSDNYKVDMFNTVDSKYVYITGLYLAHSLTNCYSAFADNSIVKYTYVTTSVSGTGKSGFGCTNHSLVIIDNCKAANKDTVVSANYGSTVIASNWNAASTNNGSLFMINNGANVCLADDTLPAYTYLKVVQSSTSGRLIDKAGIQHNFDGNNKDIKTSSVLYSTDLSVNQSITIPIVLPIKPNWIKITAGIQGSVVKSEGCWTEKGDESCIGTNSAGQCSPSYDIISLDVGAGNTTQYSVSNVTATGITLTRVITGSVTGTMWATVLCGI